MAQRDSLAELRAKSWKDFVNAVIRYRAGNRAAVVEYLRGIEAAAGRAVAEATKQSLRVCALAEGWKDVESWPSQGYYFKRPPAPEQKKKGAR